MTALRPLRATHVASLAQWLPAAALAAGCERWAAEDALRAAAGRETVLAIVGDGPIGLLEYEAASPEPDAAFVRLLLIEPERRRVGTGSRAALALERRLSRSARRLYVAVPAHMGLALYFWLRLGYRPLVQSEWPATPATPSAWMVRELR